MGHAQRGGRHAIVLNPPTSTRTTAVPLDLEPVGGRYHPNESSCGGDYLWRNLWSRRRVVAQREALRGMLENKKRFWTFPEANKGDLEVNETAWRSLKRSFVHFGNLGRVL